MELIELDGMSKLLPTMEQAKLLGVIKEPEQLTMESKNQISMKGFIIGSLITFSLFIIIMSYFKTTPKGFKIVLV